MSEKGPLSKGDPQTREKQGDERTKNFGPMN